MKQELLTVNHEAESCAIPFDKIQEVINYLSYANQIRVIWEFLFLTGARVAAIERFKLENLYALDDGDYILYWETCKNQPERKEKIPGFLVQELFECRKKIKTYGSKFFSISADTFRRYFNRDVRPNLSSDWQVRTMRKKKSIIIYPYMYQIKGLRKNFQTLEFARELDKWKSATIAIEEVSKRMKHSSTHMTAHHYIVNFETLKIDEYKHMSPAQILKTCHQSRLRDFMVNK